MRIWHLTQRAFYIDAYLFGIIVIVSIGILLAYGSLTSVKLLVLGMCSWSIAEYILHRWLFHRIMIKDHWLHHENPSGYVGAPSWLSIASFMVLMLVLYFLTTFLVAVALSLGFVFGYLSYLYFHHLCHYRIVYPNQWFYRLREDHLRHHRYAAGNFGITTTIWDRLFRTRL